jgi:F-type H+-transporting ATPase subunit a
MLQISPDHIVYWRHGFWILNSTIVTTWGLMAVMAVGCWLITRHLSTAPEISGWQNLLEILVAGIRDQIREIGLENPERYLDFVGSLFLFYRVRRPLRNSSRVSATHRLSFHHCGFGNLRIPGRSHLWHCRARHCPVPKEICPAQILYDPLNIISDLSPTVALAIRLFGNVMSGSVIAAILLSVAPLFFPVPMKSLDLLIGAVQAYILAVLATVYIAAATKSSEI